MPDVAHCGICGAAGLRPVPGLEYGEFRVFRCAACGVARVSPIPSPLELDRYYAQVYSAPRHSPGALRRNTAFAARLLARAGVSGRTVLDFGAGYGAFAGEMQRLGFRMQGLEPADEERALANRAGIPTVREVSELTPASFDAVLARHVIEHVPDPMVTLRAIRDLLKPGGVLLMAVPNFGSVAARLLRRGWEWFGPPAHLWYFDRKGLASLAAQAGLRPVFQAAVQGDGTPLPLAAAVAPVRVARRRRVAPGFWRGGTAGDAPRPSPMRKAAGATYLAGSRVIKQLWRWGDEELWMAARS
jgi:2-polyprenyl-3-methyl-5-hydroxy-6-metoxy-1,4-benzoquinol methylase